MWKLAVRQDRSATLVCEDGNGGVVYTENIPFTDFPMRAVTLWRHLPAERAVSAHGRGASYKITQVDARPGACDIDLFQMQQQTRTNEG